MTAFREMDWQEKRFEVEGALSTVLATLERIAPTQVISARVARLLGAHPDEVGGIILKLATVHPQARQDGPTFKRFGRTMRRWRWVPANEPAPVSAAPVERTPTSTEVRPEAWTAGGAAAPFDVKEERDSEGNLTPRAKAARVAADLGTELATAPYVWTE